MTLAPVVLFTYNRINHTKKTVEALQRNELAKESELFIYCDGAKNEADLQKVQSVRDYIEQIDSFKTITIIKREQNIGLAANIIDGVTSIVNQYGRVIVLEDDLLTSPYFLRFMNDALEFYKDEEKVASIHGYVYPIKNLPETFFIKGADCWGWATWDKAWSIFESDGKKLLDKIESRHLQKEANFNNTYPYTQMLKDQIKGINNSWAIRWYMSAFLKNMLTLYPSKSYVKNIGFDLEGTHYTIAEFNNFNSVFSMKYQSTFTAIIEESTTGRNAFEQFFRKIHKPLPVKIWKYFKKHGFKKIILKVKKTIF